MQSESRMGTEPIGRLMVKLAIPSIVAQVINILYNMVDRIYIGHIEETGALALTGVGLCFPILMIITAFSAFAGSGGAPLAAIQLGRGSRDEAERIMGSSAMMLAVFSVVLTAVFFIFRRPMLFAFGASADTIGYADDYLSIYLIGTVFVQAALGLNMFISSQGKASIAMLSVLIGAITNIILDPIFIFVLGMGVKGAALATILSQALSAAWVVGYLLSDKSAIRLRARYFRPNWKIVGRISALGVSPFIMQATESLISVVFNSGLRTYGGDMYVGAMTIMQSVMQLCVVTVQGFTQGVQPIISFNYGAHKLDRVRMTIRRMTAISFTLDLVFVLTAICFPTMFARLFTDEAALIELVGEVLPIYFAGMTVFGLQMSLQSSFVGLGQAKVSLIVAMMRKVVLLTPLALILPRLVGVMGIFWAEPISDVISVIVCCTLFLHVRKSIFPPVGGEP